MTELTGQSAIVVGAGHNGLVCALYLARAGYRVQVLEAREEVGGGASTQEFTPGFKVSALAHLSYGLNETVCTELGLKADALGSSSRVDTVALAQDGKHRVLTENRVNGPGVTSADAAAYVRFKEDFRRYARALEPLMLNRPPRLKHMDWTDKKTLGKLGWSLRVGLGAERMSEFLRVFGMNIFDALNEYLDDEHIKGALAVDAVLGHHMGPRTPATVLTYLQRVWGECNGAASVPMGGMGTVSQALLGLARAQGVDIHVGEAVNRILIEDDCAVGVTLQSGAVLRADVVVSNADAQTTFLDLLDVAAQDAQFVHRVSRTRTRGDVARVFLALESLPEVTGLSRHQLAQRLLIAPDMRYVERAFNHAKYGEFSQYPVLEITIPSLVDPALAPEGNHVMSISATFAPYCLKEGWPAGRQTFLDRVMAVLETYLPGIGRRVVASELLVPEDIEARFNLRGGHWHHGELSIDQSFMMRPVHGAAQYDTPVSGLYLCGAAAHPGGGISGVPGRNAARRILSAEGGRP
ncbi:MAG: NAD(P)/FAD-dependent oxidoreductase [Pseudomonadota bacterium]